MELLTIKTIKNNSFKGNNYIQLSFPNLKTLIGSENFANNQNLKNLNLGQVENLASKILNGCDNLEKIYIKLRKNFTDESEIKKESNASLIDNSDNLKIYIRNLHLKDILNDTNTFITNHKKDNVIFQEPFFTSEHTEKELRQIITNPSKYYKIVDDGDKIKNWNISFENLIEDIETVDLTNSSLTVIPTDFFKNSNVQHIILSENIEKIEANAFTGSTKLFKIELLNSNQTIFENSIIKNNNIKIITSSFQDYETLRTSTNIFINHRLSNVKLRETFTITESTTIAEISAVLTLETKYEIINDSFGILFNKLENLPTITKFPKNIKQINIKNFPFVNFDWNDTEKIKLSGNCASLNFANSNVKYVDLSNLEITKIPDNCFLNCMDLEIVWINSNVMEFGESSFENSSFYQLFVV